MKPKSIASTGRGRPHKQKVIKKEVDEIMNIDELTSTDFQNSLDDRPSVDILSCISYQKFRYSGENRPGKKYQEKNFMELKLTNLGEKVVRVVIICTDADNKELIHPNGLVGKDCHDGIYDKEYAVCTNSFNIKIPYLRTERIKTKKDELKNIREILKSRAEHLPSPYRERCESQCIADYTYNRKFDTTKVCLGVIVTVRSHFQGAFNGSLHAISHVINNASEKTSLNILKLSNDVFPIAKGGWVDIFTTEDGPAIENDKYFLYVSYQNNEGTVLWESERVSPAKDHILYKRIISYCIPPLGIDVDVEHHCKALLHLECPQSNQTCEYAINYSSPNSDFLLVDNENMKRSFTEQLEEIKPPKRMRFTDTDKPSNAIKAVLKESLKKREDDRKNSFPPEVEIVHRYNDGALVRRPDTHTVPDTMDQDNYHQNRSSPSPNQNNQEYKVLAATYSESVPSDTVLIITNDGPDGIENAIHKGVSYFEKPVNGRENNEMIIIESSANSLSRKAVESPVPPMENCQVVIVPESHSSDRRMNSTLNEQSGKIAKSSQRNNSNSSRAIQSASNKPSETPVTVFSKKNHKTDSPWSVGSDDESDEAMNIFHELSVNKQKNCLENSGKKMKLSEKVLHTEGQKTISVLSSNAGTMGKITGKKNLGSSITLPPKDMELDFSTVQLALPSEYNLNSEVIENFGLVKDIISSQNNDA